MADAPPPSYQDVVDKRSADTQLQSASFASSSSSSASGGSRFASLTLHCTDRLWVLGFPPDTYAMLDKLLFSEWAYCIQRRKELRRGCYEYKLRGEPWSVVGKDSTAACRLIIRLISALSFEGWTLDANIALSRTARNTNTLYFKEGAPRERKFSAVAFREYDKVRIIDVPVAVGEELVRQFKTWEIGTTTSGIVSHGVFEMKLGGHPISRDSEDVSMRLLAQGLLESIDALGYYIITSIGMSTGADTWILARRDSA